MYIPASFAENDPQVLADFMRAHSFATLVCQVEGVPFATHLPLYYDEKENVLLGHMARANAQWRELESAGEVLAIFTGPHAYISPTYYAEDTAVPTWNYAAVHVYGQAVLVEEVAEQKRILQTLTSAYESARAEPWVLDWQNGEHVKKLAAIAFFRIEIKKIEGKFKLSQNRSDADQQAAAEALGRVDTDNARGVAALMQKI
jgi:transcriptional regulator